jgi:hypothetical protein
VWLAAAEMTALRIEVRVRGAGGGATPKKKGAELKGMAEAAVKQWRGALMVRRD